MIRRALLGLLALGVAAPALAEHPKDSPLNPGPQDNWVKLGSFAGPHGHGDGYTDLSAKYRQPAAMPTGEYLVALWIILDRPYDLEEGGTITEERLNFRIDCGSRTVGDDGSWDGYGADGSTVSSDSSDKTTYSLSKPDADDGRSNVIDAICN